MPDVPSLSLAIIGMYCFLVWLEENHRGFLAASAVFISLAFLIKIPTAIIGVPLLYLVVEALSSSIDGQRPPLQRSLALFLRRRELWLFALITLGPSAIWYWHAHRIAETSYPYHFFGGGGFRIMDAGWYWKIAKETVLSSLTPILFVLAMMGPFVAPQGKYSRAFHWWFAVMM